MNKVGKFSELKGLERLVNRRGTGITTVMLYGALLRETIFVVKGHKRDYEHRFIELWMKHNALPKLNWWGKLLVKLKLKKKPVLRFNKGAMPYFVNSLERAAQLSRGTNIPVIIDPSILIDLF